MFVESKRKKRGNDSLNIDVRARGEDDVETSKQRSRERESEREKEREREKRRDRKREKKRGKVSILFLLKKSSYDKECKSH